ncbi:hypothetical protein BH18ACT17_BH18ACT17_10230 [soil metagenome]
MPPDDTGTSEATVSDDGIGSPPGQDDEAIQPSLVRPDDAHRRRLRPWAIGAAIGVAIVTGGVALIYTPLFGARVVEVEGEEHLAPGRIMRLADLEIGTNVLHLDARISEARLEQEPWIAAADVEVELPGTVIIVVRERTPIVVTADGEARRLVAADGTVLGRPWPTVALPLVEATPGSELSSAAVRGAGQIVRAMAPLLRVRVASLAIDPSGSVTLMVDGDVEVRYGSAAEVTAKAQALRAILEYADDDGRGLISVDVSAPAAPTARFVGSVQPAAVPDPSADVADPEDEAPADDIPAASSPPT